MTVEATVENPVLIFEELQAVVKAAMERLRIPGVEVGILYEGQEYTAGLGVNNLNHPLPVTPDTLFQIASISKTFTGTAIMRLVDMGKIELDEAILTYLPDLNLSSQELTTQVTMRHLLTHTAGWVGDHFEDTGPGDDALAKYVGRMANLPQLTPLGTVWSYSNSSFTLAGRVIEAVTGKTYEAAVKELVLDPLGLEHTFFTANDAIIHRVAVGHRIPYTDEGVVEIAVPWAWARSSHSLGGLVSTVKDLLRYARFHLGDGTIPTPIEANSESKSTIEDEETPVQLLSKETLQLMKTKQSEAGSLTEAIGLPWMLGNVAGITTVGHGGTANGQTSTFQLVPEKNFAIVVLTNANFGSNLYGEVVTWALKHYLGIEATEPELLKLEADQLEQFTGYYSASLSDVDIKIEGDQLVLQSIPKGGFPTLESPAPPTPPLLHLAFTSADHVVGQDFPFKGAKGEFLRDKAGNIEWFRFGGRIHKRKV